MNFHGSFGYIYRKDHTIGPAFYLIHNLEVYRPQCVSQVFCRIIPKHGDIKRYINGGFGAWLCPFKVQDFPR